MTPIEALLKRLHERGDTVGTAESCTGGMLAAAITDVPGASEVFRGSVVAYHNDVKQTLLGVDIKTLEYFGAVSEATAMEMAAGARVCLGVTYGVGITGVAGPGGGTDEKPVGLVYIAVCGPEGGHVTRNEFEGDRSRVRSSSVEYAVKMLLEISA